MMRRHGRIVAVLIVFLSTALLPFAAWGEVSYALNWLFLLAVYVTLAASYDIVGGYTGYLNLGHVAFFGIGGYSTALLLNLGFQLPVCFASGSAMAALFAVCIGFPLFRLKGAYFALGTFGLLNLLGVLCNNASGLTGGPAGLSMPPGDHSVPAYYAAVAIAAGTVWLSRLIAASKFGFGLVSIREDEAAAETLGVPTDRYKWAALVVSSIPAGLIGGVFAWKMTYISPVSMFGLEIALSPIVMAMLGGSGTLAGPILGALFLTVVQEVLWARIPYLHLALYGITMMLAGLFLPGGLVRILIRGIGRDAR
jgi:ABC-type branched-subunit amino acid transport system permease subunit